MFTYHCPGCGHSLRLKKRAVVSSRHCRACGTEITWQEIQRQDNEKRRQAEAEAARQEAIREENLAATRELIDLQEREMELAREKDALEEREHRRRVIELRTAFFGFAWIAFGMTAIGTTVAMTMWALAMHVGYGWAVFFVLLFSPIWLTVIAITVVAMRSSFYDKKE